MVAHTTVIARVATKTKSSDPGGRKNRIKKMMMRRSAVAEDDAHAEHEKKEKSPARKHRVDAQTAPRPTDELREEDMLRRELLRGIKMVSPRSVTRGIEEGGRGEEAAGGGGSGDAQEDPCGRQDSSGLQRRRHLCGNEAHAEAPGHIQTQGPMEAE